MDSLQWMEVPSEWESKQLSSSINIFTGLSVIMDFALVFWPEAMFYR